METLHDLQVGSTRDNSDQLLLLARFDFLYETVHIVLSKNPIGIIFIHLFEEDIVSSYTFQTLNECFHGLGSAEIHAV